VDLGISFQIKDDCQDYSGDEAETGKKTGVDIACNIITAPVLVALNNSDSSQLIDIIKNRRMLCHCDYILKVVKERNGVEISDIASLAYNRSCLQKLKSLSIHSIPLFSQIIKSAYRDN
jgi:geranylgeranyl pyrophosphate synthase